MPADEIGMLNGRIIDFSRQWTSHNRQLRATGGLLHDMFVVLVSDESAAGASGCSIDTSVKFVRQLGEEYQIDFFDRLHFTYLQDEQVHRLHRDQIAEAYAKQQITDETLFFDNLVKDKGEFLKRWVTPFGDSWLKRFA